MPQQTNLNVSPYYADYNPLSDYYKVLYKAGYPIQARELTNTQLMLQNQIETIASRILKEGDNVVPGNFGIAVPVPYVRLSSITQGATATEYVGYTLTGVVSGVKAFVNFATDATEDDDTTFFVNYESSGTTTTESTFLEGETLESDTPNKYTATVGINTISKPITTTPMGSGSLFSAQEGYYFVDGTAVRNATQTITLDKYSVTPSYEVGFLVTEEFITSSEDPALLDNSQGSSNFAAPGADRLKITLTLQKREIDSTNPNFITLATIQNGSVLGKPDQTVKWDWLFDILAKRTFDESGDYIITEFPIQPMEYWNSNTINGVFDVDTVTETYPPVPGSGETNRLTPAQADEQYAIKVDPGAGYVQGYEVGFRNPTYVYGKKPRAQSFRPDSLTQITEGYNVTVTNMNCVPDFQDIKSNVDTLAFDTITLYRNFTDGFVGEGSDANGKPFNIGNAPPTTYHIITDQAVGSGDLSPAVPVYVGTNSAVVTSATAIKRGDTLGAGTVMVSTVVKPQPSGVMNPRYLMPNQQVDDYNGLFGYNSTYNLGVMQSTYFTELVMVEDTNSTNYLTDWTVGDLVFGEKTASQGIVEAGSTPGILLVSNVSGEFAPGEDVTQGSKASRITKEGEVLGFDFLDKGTNGTTVSLENETSIKVKAIGSELSLTKGVDFLYNASTNSLVPTTTGRTAMLNFPYPEGSVLNTRINYDVETGPSVVKGYAVVLAAKVQNTLTNSKAFYAPLEDVNDFSADISIQNNVDSEVIALADNSLFSGTANTNYITCDNFSGDPAEQLLYGDLVTFVDDTGSSISKFVYFATKPVGYGSLRSKSIIYFTTTIPNSVTGKTVQRIRVKSKGSPQQNLIFQLPQAVIASLETDPITTRIDYQVYREFVVSANGGTNQVTLTTGSTNETFVSNLNQTTISVAELPSDATNSTGYDGRNLTIASADVTQDQGRKIVYTLSAALPTQAYLKILAPVYVTNAKAKRKIFRENQTLEISAANAGGEVLSLGRPDVYTLKTITMLSGGVQLDVTANYALDNGQRDNVYDIARLILKPGMPKATGDLTITYDYFDHSDAGDFFSADSYTDDDGVGYRAIPVYSPISGIPYGTAMTNAIVYQLRDCADFRPIVNTTGADPSVIASITSGKDAQNSINFKDAQAYDGNAFVPRLPIPGTQFKCDLSYYLPKYDSLFLEKTGALTLIEGVSSENPIPPPDMATGIRLYNLYLPAYTFTTVDIVCKKFNYKRYRMSDIAAMEGRIDRVEELVTLSILEQSALNTSVRDAVTGLDRFKNGIVVDTFRDHSKGDVGTSQYRNSIDPKWSHLRSPHYTDQAELVDKNQTAVQRLGDGYINNNSIITCEYTSKRFVQNPIATRFINLQPFTVFTYDGNLELTPSIDTFNDVNRLPDLVIEDNNLFDAMVNLTGELADSGIGTVWGEWETTGTQVTSNTTVIRNQPGGNMNAVQNAINAAAIMGVTTQTQELSDAGWQLFARGQSPPLRVTNTTTSTSQAREQTKTQINVSTGSVQNTSYGDRVVDVQVATTMRTIPVLIQAYRLKPNTRYYCYFDGVDISSWVSIDNTTTGWPDGIARYSGVPNSNPKGFGYSLVSDGVGTLTGLMLIPNGRPPVVGTTFGGSLADVSYQTTGPTRSFNTGTRTVRFTSHPNNSLDSTQIEGFAEASFVSSGVIMDKQETVVSTRLPSFSHTSTVVGTDTRVLESQETTSNYFDPVAQTFMVDDNNPEGVMVTELDVFFKTKDATQGCEVYLTTTDGQVPTEQIIPHSRVQKGADSNLRVICSSLSGSSEELAAGITVTGSFSGATGVIKSNVNFQSAGANATTNVSNHVYNVLLSNYKGEFQQGEALVPQVSPASSSTYSIATNEYVVKSVDLKGLGSGYTSATVAFSAPELPGGVTAAATAKVGNGMVYEITITEAGSGYTTIPSVTIAGDGSGATATVRATNGAEAVVMGVCTSEDATAATKFKFHAPVFLLGDTNYGFVVKAPTSLNFNIWTSKLGENQLGTELRVVEQPSLGSLFMSQNGGLWTEDQTQDVMFTLWRADFVPNQNAVITLENAPLAIRPMVSDPIETNVDGSNSSSNLFGDNPAVVRCFAYMNGLAPNDLVFISGVSGSPGGIPDASINTLHTVLAADINFFYVQCDTAATSAARAGGQDAFCSMNRPYEVIDVYTGAMVFGSSNLTATNRATKCAGLSGYNSAFQYKMDSPKNIRLMESYYYDEPMQVASYVNEAKYNGSLYLQGNRSLSTEIRMNTVSSKVSPVIDLERTNATIIRNVIDNPKNDDPGFGVQSATLQLGGDTSSVGTLNAGALIPITNQAFIPGTTVETTINEGSLTVVSWNRDTKKLKVSGSMVNKIRSSASDLSNGFPETSLVHPTDTALNALTILRTTTNDGLLFIPETSNNGSVYSKWISRLFIFENPCDGVEIKCASIFYDKESIKLYYRPRNIGFDGDLTEVNWIPFNGTGLPDQVEAIHPRSASVVDPRVMMADDWQSLTWSTQDIAKFDGLAVKIVMTQDNPAKAPLLDDIQIICSE